MNTGQSEIEPKQVEKILSEPTESGLLVSDNSALQQPVEERFRNLVTIWQSERPPSSYLGELVSHPAYMQIIGLGPAAIPLLLRELEQNLDWWVVALHAITGADPVPAESRGKLREMAQAWLTWGRTYGYYQP